MYKKISDNIHGTIIIEEENKFIWNLIETKEFSRLSRISQLGLVSMIYPNATHSRKSHSLGVYELARQIIVILKPQVDKLTIKAILAASLLHDIGHGPLSHLFEGVSSISHEDYSVDIILNPKSEINRILTLENKDLPEQVAKIILKSHPISWVNAILSSEIDVDRLDYLIRDSYNTNTKYGLIDLNYIKNNLSIKDNQLVFSYKSLPALENFVLGRYHMYLSVYLHPKNLAFQALYTMLFERIKFLLDQKYEFQFDISLISLICDEKMINIDKYFQLDDNFFWLLVSQSKNENDLILSKIASYLITGKIPNIVNYSSELENKLKTSKHHTEFKIIELDKNFKTYGSKQKEQAKILTSSNEIIPLKKYSEIISSISNKFVEMNIVKYIIEI